MVRKWGAVATALVISLIGAASAQASASGLVVSQVYGGGGNSGAPLRSDFIELFNAGTTAASLTGYTVRYQNASGSFTDSTALSGSIAAGGYYLVKEADGAGTTLPALPDPDAADTISMSATSGSVALIYTGGNVVDLVGFGTSTTFETAAAPAPSNTTADVRADGGCTDTNDNSKDFTAQAPAPRNSASAPTTCSGPAPIAAPTSSPGDGASGVPVGTDVTLTFAEDVTVDDGFATLTCDGTDVPVTVTGGARTFTLDPAADLGKGQSCAVTVDAAKVHAGDRSLGGDVTIDFTTETDPIAIHDIQGAGHRSPLVGQRVRTRGIVTATRSNGFWIQDPQPDADVRTSEGILVFTRSRPAVSVGDAVDLTATVSEFRPAAAGLTITELDSPSITVVSSGNQLPAAQLIGPDGRQPSSTVIEDDASNVETNGVFDVGDGIDFYESLEGMRVEVDDAVVSGPTADFGSNREIPVLPANGAGASVRTPRGGIIVRPADFNPERIILNDALSGGVVLPAADVGDHFTGATVGVLDYSFSNFKLQVTTLGTFASGGLQREVTAPAGTGQLAFATFNVENLAPQDPQSKFDRLAGLIVDNLRAPDLLSLEEVQDDNGATNDAVVDASQTFAKLIAAITAAGGPTYEYRQIDPVDDQDGGQPGGNIRVGFLFRTDRGLAFVDRPGGTPTTPVSVTPGPHLSSSPGRIQPTDPAFNASRKPLAGEFTYDGQTWFVIANHWNSKGGDEPLYGPHQPPDQVSEAQRVQQATIVHDFVAQLLRQDPRAHVVVLGDLNDFSFSDALRTLRGTPRILEDLIGRLPEGEQYSYVFEGNSQALDHILTSVRASSDVRSIDAVHVNAEFADQASDHDPLVADLCADERAPSLDVTLSPSTLWPPNGKLVRVKATTTATDTVDPSPTVRLAAVTSNGSGAADDIKVIDDHTFDLRAEKSPRGADRIYTVSYSVTDACGNSTVKSARITVTQ